MSAVAALSAAIDRVSLRKLAPGDLVMWRTAHPRTGGPAVAVGILRHVTPPAPRSWHAAWRSATVTDLTYHPIGQGKALRCAIRTLGASVLRPVPACDDCGADAGTLGPATCLSCYPA